MNEPQDLKEYRIEYFPISSELFAASLGCTERELLPYKWKMLAKLGIAQDDSKTPWDAWLDHLCKINEVEYTRPIDANIARGIEEIPDAARFAFFLVPGDKPL